MRSACIALLLLLPLAVPARGEDNSSDRTAQYIQEQLKRVTREIARTQEILAAGEKEWAETEEAYRRRAKALEQQLANLMGAHEKVAAERKAGIARLRDQLQLLTRQQAALADKARTEKAALPAAAFSGKPLLVLAKDQVAHTLVKAELRHLGGRTFVVGKEARGSSYTRERFDGG